MKKSELKKYILEALTPDEASKVDAKYKEIYAGMVGKNPLKMKKYDNPDKVAYGRAINLIQKESLKLAEKLGKKAKVGDYIEDFTDSDAPQFKGKSDKKKKQMAVAAFLNKEEQKLDEIDAMMEDAQEKSEKNYSNYFKKMDKNRLEEFVKAALMKETSTDKYDDNPALKGKQSDLPDGLQKAIIKKSGGKVDEAELPSGVLTKLNQEVKDIPTMAKAMLSLYNQIKDKEQLDFSSNASMKIVLSKLQDLASKGKANESFDSLVKKVDKAKGYTKKEAEKVAGAIAAKKMKGAGKGPTAKQKKRMAETILKELRGNINEALNKDLKDVGMDIAKYLKEKGLEPKFIQGENLKLYQDFPENGSLLSLMDGGARLEIAVNDSKIDTLKEIIKKYNLQSLQSLKQTGGWADDPKKKSQSKGEIYITSEKPQRRGKAFTLELKRFDPSEIK